MTDLLTVLLWSLAAAAWLILIARYAPRRWATGLERAYNSNAIGRFMLRTFAGLTRGIERTGIAVQKALRL